MGFGLGSVVTIRARVRVRWKASITATGLTSGSSSSSERNSSKETPPSPLASSRCMRLRCCSCETRTPSASQPARISSLVSRPSPLRSSVVKTECSCSSRCSQKRLNSLAEIWPSPSLSAASMKACTCALGRPRAATAARISSRPRQPLPSLSSSANSLDDALVSLLGVV